MKRLPSQPRLRTLAALGLALGVLGCYNPKISEKFKCNMNYEANAGQCPDGFHCSDGLCKKGPAPKDAGSMDVPSEKPVTPPPDAPIEKPAPMDTPPEVACFMPVPSCTGDTTKVCDPFCQTGCGCHDKCALNSVGALECVTPSSTIRLHGAFENCDPLPAGIADICAPGLVCRVDGCSARCYPVCRADKDCPNSFCLPADVGSGVRVCDVPTKACNPVKPAAGMADGCGTTTDTLVCFLSASVTDRTVCDCPFKPQGMNGPCTFTHDCYAGLVCAGADPHCRPACNLANGNADCQVGICTKHNGSNMFGYCN
jgi:hypothetical protein